MKKIVYVIALTLITISCKAQSNIINIVNRCNNNYSNTNGTTYLKDVNNLYAPFIGTWKWIDGNRELVLKLIKQTKYHYNQGNSNYYEDRIVGYYIYKENGITLINTSNDNLTVEFPKICLDFDCYSQLVIINFVDILKNKDYDGWIELISSNSIKFHFKEDTHMRIQKEGSPTLPPVYLGTSFPLDIVLAKQ